MVQQALTAPVMLVLFFFFIFLYASSSYTLPVTSESNSSVQVQWQTLTKLNYSSQIHLHGHILLMVTVPWSGESRSLMKDLAYVITNKQVKFGMLKLMVLYRNNEKMLADALGATEGITILCYRHSVSYKYQGRLRVQNILSSAHYLMTVAPTEVPLKFLNTSVDLKMFLESTDKSFLLFEFCGWTHKLLAKGRNNLSEYVSEGIFGAGFNGETSEALEAERKQIEKQRMENENMNCGVDNGFNAVPWLLEFNSVNGSDFLESESMRPNNGVTCSFEEFQQFESFLSKFMTVVREFFLPPERVRFGLIPERSLLSSLGVGKPGPWLMLLYFAGCPSCSKILGEEDDLKNVLQMQVLPATEIEGIQHDLELALPANRPSVLLFIDRSSDSSKLRRRSKEALDAFRELALHHQMSHQRSGRNTAMPDKFLGKVYQASRSASAHPRLELSSTFQRSFLKDKMSVMIMNEGKHISVEKFASDLPGSSLHEIVAYVIQQKKEMKLSTLAKDVGFQLLSDDLDINLSEPLAAQAEVQSNEVIAEASIEANPKGTENLKTDQIPLVSGISDRENEEELKFINPESIHDDEKTIAGITTQLYVEPDYYYGDNIVSRAKYGKAKQQIISEVEKEQQQPNLGGFRGSFFFLDGHDWLLKALTSNSEVPSAVIFDPIAQKHYVFPGKTVFSYSSLSDFIDRFLNGSLLPYQRSESVVLSTRQAPTPPFVNLDFHEVDSIPRVTIHMFSEMVIGNQSDSKNARCVWEKDVLVLFTNSWCGFCQRMELVVREVYNAIKGYTTMLKNASGKEQSLLSGEYMGDAVLKLPLIYLMDCVLNDCSLILQSISQKELYPSLVLFPAESKNAIFYGGDAAVSDIITFIADHGSNSHTLVRGKGTLWTGDEQGGKNWYLYKEAHVEKDKYHEILLKEKKPKVLTRYNQTKPHAPNGSHETDPQVVTGSILIATQKLINAHPFDNSKILIVQVNRSTGFQGLIINKHINWNSLGKLEEGLELLKEAPLSFGGPVIQHGLPLVALAQKFINDQYLEVLPKTYFLDQWATLNIIDWIKLGNQSVSDYWFFLGYSIWEWDQLFHEIAEDAWRLSNSSVEQLDWPWR